MLCASTSSAIASMSSTRRATATTCTPSAANAFAIARPMPMLAPVTKAVFPLSCRSIICPFSVHQGMVFLYCNETAARLMVAESETFSIRTINHGCNDGIRCIAEAEGTRRVGRRRTDHVRGSTSLILVPGIAWR